MYCQENPNSRVTAAAGGIVGGVVKATETLRGIQTEARIDREEGLDQLIAGELPRLPFNLLAVPQLTEDGCQFRSLPVPLFETGDDGGIRTACCLDRYPPMADNGDRVELIETPTFTKQITALLSDEEYGEFQSQLAANPQLGPLLIDCCINNAIMVQETSSCAKTEG